MKFLFNRTILSLAAALFVLASCGDKKSETTAGETAQTPADSTATGARQVSFSQQQYALAGIESGIIEQRNLSSVIKLNGIIDVEPHSMASVSAPLGGYVKTAGLLPGEYVKKGQVLAVLDNPEFITIQEDYLASKSRLQFLEQEYKRQQKLREEDVNAAKTFQQVESDYQIIKAKLSGLEQRLELAGVNISALQSGKIGAGSVRSPINGYIKESNVNIGKYVNPTDVLFEIVDKTDLHLALNAFEKDLGKIKEGQVVKYSLANENNYNRTAEVFLVAKSTSNDKVIPVHCHLAQKNNPDLVPGMYVKAWVETGAEKQYAAPSSAIVQLEGKDYIILESASSNGYTFSFEEIKKGIEQEGYTAIESPGINRIIQGKIVLKNAYSILSALINSEEEE